MEEVMLPSFISVASSFCHFESVTILQYIDLEMTKTEYEEMYVKNSRGVQLFTCKWLPLSSPRALVFLCHAYATECSDYMKGCGTKLASAGYAVIGLDYEGHGRSKGTQCYINKFDDIVSDCDVYFRSICEKEVYRNKKRILYGESMGGVVALMLHKMDPTFWNGAVLVAPMCKISQNLRPHPVASKVLRSLGDLIPKWRIIPTRDFKKGVIDSGFKDPTKREEMRRNKLIYQDKPRVKTICEMVRASTELENSLSEVTIPFLVLHGEEDTVTDPETSRALYIQAESTDKTIILYPGMWHGLTFGEPDYNVEIVFNDILDWLDKRTSGAHNATLSASVQPAPHLKPQNHDDGGFTVNTQPISMQPARHDDDGFTDNTPPISVQPARHPKPQNHDNDGFTDNTPPISVDEQQQ